MSSKVKRYAPSKKLGIELFIVESTTLPMSHLVNIMRTRDDEPYIRTKEVDNGSKC